MWTHLLYRCKVNRQRNRPTFLNGFILGAIDVGGETINMRKQSNANATNIFIVILLILNMPILNELRELEITLSRTRVACFQFSVSWFTSGRRKIIALHLLSCFISYARNKEVRKPTCIFEMHLCWTLCFKFLGAFANHFGKRPLACPSVRLATWKRQTFLHCNGFREILYSGVLVKFVGQITC